MDICFATNNVNKLNEVRDILGNRFNILSLQDIGCDEELAEDQDTIEGNSRQKAAYVFEHYKIACFADDTGLEVHSLNGEPGVKSARYAGEQRSNQDNIEKLLSELKNKSRIAQFKTVITLITPNLEKQFEGIVKGVITEELKGAQGFGYDPVFIPEGHSRTFAEMSSKQKNAISHRGRAVSKLAAFLQSMDKDR